MNYVTDVLVPLGSALLGAIAGVGATLWATKTALRQDREDAAREREARQNEAAEEKVDRNRRLINALASEVDDNIIGQAAEDALIANFATQAWDRAREISGTLPANVYEPLQAAYAAAASFNSKWDWAKSVSGLTGRYNETLRNHAVAVVQLLERARDPLIGWMDDSHSDKDIRPSEVIERP